MKTHVDKTQKNKSRAVANTVSRKQSSGGTFQLVDNRPETVQLQKLQEIIANSPHAKKIAQFQAMMDNSKNPHHVQLQKMQEMIANSQLGKTAVLPGVLQKKGPLDEEELQFKSKEAVQKKGPLDEEELQFKKDKAVQCKGPEDEDDLQFKAKDTAQLAGPLDEEELQFKAEEPVQKQENKTGLPDDLKAGVENLSGMAMDDVRVHYNSGKPAQLNAYAYTQGTEIHVAPGQEKHLPHEAWHVVQQKQGRVQPTVQMAGGVAVNDDAGLENEADVMGGKALQFEDNQSEAVAQRKIHKVATYNSQAIQRVGGQKFGLEAVGDRSDKDIVDGLKKLKETLGSYKAYIKANKERALQTQQTEATKAALIIDESQRRNAQIAAQTKYTAALKQAEMNPTELVHRAGEGFAISDAGVVSYKNKKIATVHVGAAAYQQVQSPRAAGYSAVYKRHTLDGLSGKEYVSDGQEKFLRRTAYRGITPPEAEQIREGRDLIPLNANYRNEGKLGFNFDHQHGWPVERDADKGTDLQFLNQVTKKNLSTVPESKDVRAYLQVRKGVGKYFSATSTPKSITSNHDGSFTDKGQIAFDLAAVPQRDMLHHYKANSLLASDIHAAVGGGKSQPQDFLRQDVERGNESVVRNREIVLNQIPHGAITEVNGQTRAAFEQSFRDNYTRTFQTAYESAINTSGLTFQDEVTSHFSPIVPQPASKGFGALLGQTTGQEQGRKAGAAAANAVIVAGQKFMEQYEKRYYEGWNETYFELAFLEATEKDIAEAASFQLDHDEIPKNPLPNLKVIPSIREQAATLNKAKTQGSDDAEEFWKRSHSPKSESGDKKGGDKTESGRTGRDRKKRR